jgi:hypothetical protein
MFDLVMHSRGGGNAYVSADSVLPNGNVLSPFSNFHGDTALGMMIRTRRNHANGQPTPSSDEA